MTKYGIDFDGTISNTTIRKSEWILERLGIVVAPWNTDKTSCVPVIGLQNYELMGEEVYEREGTLKTPEIEGAIEGLARLARENELYLITFRSPRRTEFSKEWLAARDALKYFSGFGEIMSPSGEKKIKEMVCRELGLAGLVDDDTRHLLKIQLPDFKKVLIKAGSDQVYSLPGDILLARNWPEVVEHISAK